MKQTPTTNTDSQIQPMEKLQVTHCVWIQSYTKNYIGINLTYFCKLFSYGVNRKHYVKYIGIREYSEQLAYDLFWNPFPTDTGTPDKNIPILGVFNLKYMVVNSICIDFTTSLYHDSHFNPYYDLTFTTVL